jgi:hypothetical protein
MCPYEYKKSVCANFNWVSFSFVKLLT